MKLKERIFAKRHMFMPGHTVGAVIKQYNLYDVSREEMLELVETFKDINANAIFKPGMSALIPILPRLKDAVFTPEDIR